MPLSDPLASHLPGVAAARPESGHAQELIGPAGTVRYGGIGTEPLAAPGLWSSSFCSCRAVPHLNAACTASVALRVMATKAVGQKVLQMRLFLTHKA
ncbi:MAG: hypothetical protein KGO02_08115, partial [Alphaproteobacteria bacterium]|nr:hypothetical protein [Alphaproteobacteria bacterium]